MRPVFEGLGPESTRRRQIGGRGSSRATVFKNLLTRISAKTRSSDKYVNIILWKGQNIYLIPTHFLITKACCPGNRRKIWDRADPSRKPFKGFTPNDMTQIRDWKTYFKQWHWIADLPSDLPSVMHFFLCRTTDLCKLAIRLLIPIFKQRLTEELC